MPTQHSLTGSERTDEALLLAVREGDFKSFGELYERYLGMARSIAYRHTNDSSHVDDIVSETFARILQALKNGKGPRSYMGAYLATTIAHLAGEYGLLESREVPSEEEHLESMGSLDETVLKLHESDEVISAFTSLPERWQTVLWLTEVEAKKPREVALAMDLSPNAVSALAVRAKESLKEGFLRAHQNSPTTPACTRFYQYISPYVRGSLSQKRSDALRSHMETCGYCTSEYLSLVGINRSMRSWIFPVLAGLSLWSTDGAVVVSSAALVSAGASGTAVASVAGSSEAGSTFSLLTPKSWGSGAQIAAGTAAVTAASIAVVGGAFLIDPDGGAPAQIATDGRSIIAQDSSASEPNSPGSEPTALGAEFSETARSQAAQQRAKETEEKSQNGSPVPALEAAATDSSAEDGLSAVPGADGVIVPWVEQPVEDGIISSEPGFGEESQLGSLAQPVTDTTVQAPSGYQEPAIDTLPTDNPENFGGTGQPEQGGPGVASPAEETGSGTPAPGGNTGEGDPTPIPVDEPEINPGENATTPDPNTGTDPGEDSGEIVAPDPGAGADPGEETGPGTGDNVELSVPDWYNSDEYRTWFAQIPWDDIGKDPAVAAGNRLCLVTYIDSDGAYHVGTHMYLPQVLLNSQYTYYTLSGYYGWGSTVSIICL